MQHRIQPNNKPIQTTYFQRYDRFISRHDTADIHKDIGPIAFRVPTPLGQTCKTHQHVVNNG
jgi:hypothetical protein